MLWIRICQDPEFFAGFRTKTEITVQKLFFGKRNFSLKTFEIVLFFLKLFLGKRNFSLKTFEIVLFFVQNFLTGAVGTIVLNFNFIF
jgi:hypothetical protein